MFSPCRERIESECGVQGVGCAVSALIVYRGYFLNADIVYLLSVVSRRSEWRD